MPVTTLFTSSISEDSLSNISFCLEAGYSASRRLSQSSPSLFGRSRPFSLNIQEDLLADVRGEGMKRPERTQKNPHEHVERVLFRLLVPPVEGEFRYLEIPVAVIVPDEVVERLRSLVEFVAFNEPGDFPERDVQPG